MENWKQIESHPKYFVSDKGRVKSYNQNKEGHILKHNMTAENRDRAVVQLCENGKKHRCLVSRLVAEAFIPNPKNKSEVNHLDGNPLNNNVDNLEWCTRKENVKHAIENGFITIGKKGKENHNSKLTANDVLQIRSIYQQGFFEAKEISKAYNISLGHFYLIIKKKRWTYI